MKYMLLIHNNPAFYESWSEDERMALFGEVGQIMTELTESGELVASEALADGSNTKTVRVRDGVPAVTDGPFAEAKEHLGGFYIINAEDLDAAVALAAKVTRIIGVPIEVRPFADFADEPKH